MRATTFRLPLLLVCLYAQAVAERLPLRHFTIVDGLADNTIYRMVRDSRGYLWFCTSGGLSRFDGSFFTTYRVQDGLPADRVHQLLETRAGEYWVATAAGVARWNPEASAKARFTVFRQSKDALADRVEDLAEDAGGALLLATGAGLFRMRPGSSEPRFTRIPLPDLNKTPKVAVLLRGRDGDLWVGGIAGLNRVRVSGAREWLGRKDGLPTDNVISLAQDREGRIWAGMEGGICKIDSSGPARVERCYQLGGGGPGNYIQSILPRGDGSMWLASLNGPALFEPASGSFRVYSRAAGFTTANIESLAEDVEGNVWFGSGDGGGGMRIVGDGAVVYTEADGLDSSDIVGFAAGEDGAVHALSRRPDGFALHRYDGTRFTRVALAVPPEVRSAGRSLDQSAVRSRDGGWWIATGTGALHYAHGSSRGAVIAPPTTQAANVFRLFEDSRGDLWIGLSSLAKNELYRRRHSTGGLERLADRGSLPALRHSPPTAFCEDRGGNVWFGLEFGGWLRDRQGKIEDYSAAAPALANRIWSALADSSGRIWVGTNDGLVRIDGPETAVPRFRVYSTAEGLGSNSIRTLVAGADGRLYLGTPRGVDEFDPESGQVRSFSVDDGLPLATVQASFRDPRGTLWFGTAGGAFVLQPRRAGRALPPRVFISGLRLQGVPYEISALGETRLAGIELPHDRNALEVSFASIYFRPAPRLRFQYRIDGAAGWSAPIPENRVALSGLAPGRYSFRVRAAAGDSTSLSAATLDFRILPPFWMRWWFLSGCAAALAALGYAWHTMRLARLLGTERLRTRIAADLHDDIGASLTHIAIMSEVAESSLNGDAPQVRETLGRIGHASREVIDSLGDIVWAIDPGKDHVRDLSQRMRRWVSDLLTSRNIALRFESAETDATLDAEMRRELFLIFKEAVHNLARHSHCSAAYISLRCENGGIRMEIRDDGRGFDPAQAGDGHGLLSMHRRAEKLAGVLELRSKPGGGGAAVIVSVPVRRSRLQ